MLGCLLCCLLLRGMTSFQMPARMVIMAPSALDVADMHGCASAFVPASSIQAPARHPPVRGDMLALNGIPLPGQNTDLFRIRN